MNSDQKVVNYKVLDLIQLYKVDIQLIYIRSHLEIWIRRTYNDILKYKTLSNTKIYNYKVLNLVEQYNFGIELIYIWDNLMNWYFNLNVYHIILFNS